MAVSTIDPNGLNIGQIGGRRLNINGDFSIAQRGTSFTTDNVYTLDRWYSGDGTGGSPARTLSQETFTLGQTDVPGAYYYLRHNQTGASTNGNASLVQKVEDVTRFDGQTVTLSFYAKANAAMDIDIRFIQDFGTGGSPSADVTLTETVSIGTSWTKYTVTKTLGSLSGKTLGTDGVHTSFLSINTEFQPTTTFTFDLALCQLEYGDVATPFEHRSYGEELNSCMRFYQQWNAVEVMGAGIWYGSGQVLGHFPFKHEMRTAPTITVSSAAFCKVYYSVGTIQSNDSGSPFDIINSSSARINIGMASSGASPGGQGALIQTESGAAIYVDAEL